MKRLARLAGAVFLLAASLAFGQNATVAVGGTPIVIPTPKGYTRVTPADGELNRMMERFTPPQNRLLAHYFSTPDYQAYTTRKQGFTLERFFMSQVYRSSEGETMTPAQFATVRATLRNQLPEMLKKIEPLMDQIRKNAVESTRRETGKQLSLEVSQQTALGVYQESDTSIEFGMLQNVKASADARAADRLVICVSSFVNLKGKLLFFYTYANVKSAADIEWAKQASIAWTREILAANR